jgi:colicin import membrane protein
MNGLFGFLALAGALVAIYFFLSGRGVRAEAARHAAEAERLRAEVGGAQEVAAKARAEAKERREEASVLRADLDRTKKRAFEQQEGAKRAGGAVALREELDKAAARLAEARAEAEHQAGRAKALEREADRARVEIERLKARPDPVLAAAPAPAAVTPATPVAPPAASPSAATHGLDPALLAEEKDRADKAEVRFAEAKKRVLELEKDLKAVRGRLETEKRVYMVQKSELELASDRNVELRRRHDALRKEHDELIEAVRQAAREDRRDAEEAQAAAGGPAAKPA